MSSQSRETEDINWQKQRGTWQRENGKQEVRVTLYKVYVPHSGGSAHADAGVQKACVKTPRELKGPQKRAKCVSQ